MSYALNMLNTELADLDKIIANANAQLTQAEAQVKSVTDLLAIYTANRAELVTAITAIQKGTAL